MQSVPVGSSIAHAYEFVLESLTKVLGTAWLPALLYAAGLLLFFQNMHDWMPAERHDLASVVLTACTFVGAGAFTLMIGAVIGISLTQEALGVRKDLTLAHFVIGPREIRLFFSYVRFYLIAALLYVAVLALSVGAMFVAEHYGTGIASGFAPAGFSLAVLAAAFLTAALFIWYLLAMLRLSFLISVVAAAEHHASLTRGWRLTQGSTFRIAGVYLGISIPLKIAAAIALYFLIGPDQWAAAFQAAAQQTAGMPSAWGPFYAAHASVFAATAGVLTLAGAALLSGASAHAYRAVTGHELAEPEDDAALVVSLHEPEMTETPAIAHHRDETPPVVHHDGPDHSMVLNDEASRHGPGHEQDGPRSEVVDPNVPPSGDEVGPVADHAGDGPGHLRQHGRGLRDPLVAV